MISRHFCVPGLRLVNSHPINVGELLRFSQGGDPGDVSGVTSPVVGLFLKCQNCHDVGRERCVAVSADTSVEC